MIRFNLSQLPLFLAQRSTHMIGIFYKIELEIGELNKYQLKQKKNPKMSCNILGFRFIFCGTQLFDGDTSNNEDHKV